MEDTLAEGFRGHRQLSYAHWITFLIHRAVTVRPPEMLAEYSGATTEFLAYNMTQMLRHSRPSAPSQPRRCPEVPESVAQQDETIRGIIATEEEQLDAQQEGMVGTTPVIAQMMTTRISLRCLLDDMTMRPAAPVQLHLHHRQTPLYLLYLSG